MGWVESGVPSNVRARAAEYRVDAAGGAMLRMYGLVVCGGMALVAILTIPNHWPNVVSMAPTIVFAALLVVPMLWLSRSRAAHRSSYFGRARGRWTFQRTHLRLCYTDPNTGQPREVRSDLYMHPDEKLAPGQVIGVRRHPTLPEPVFVPVQG